MRPSLNFKDQLGSSHETEKIVRREPSECSWLTTALSPRIILLCPVEAYPKPNVRDGALGRQDRVLIWIDGHIPPRVKEFFLTDWMHGHRIG